MASCDPIADYDSLEDRTGKSTASMSGQELKIVLSRKGFDLGSGGCASPIFPNGRLYSLPIPYTPGAQNRYANIGNGIGLDGSDMGTVVEHLTAGRVRRDDFAHLDPDLDASSVPRLTGWRPAFGQCEASQVHLANQRVGVGDVFLFHGWFRAISQDRACLWRFQSGAPNLSVIFGWMQVGEVIDLQRTPPQVVLARYPWLRDHPHLHFPADLGLSPPANAIYLAADRLTLPGNTIGPTPGAGVFGTFHPRLVLTAIGNGSDGDRPVGGRSVWSLPRWFKGDAQRPWLTQFPRPEWWTDHGEDEVLLRPVGRQGQEAVLDCGDRAGAVEWVASLMG